MKKSYVDGCDNLSQLQHLLHYRDTDYNSACFRGNLLRNNVPYVNLNVYNTEAYLRI